VTGFIAHLGGGESELLLGEQHPKRRDPTLGGRKVVVHKARTGGRRRMHLPILSY